MSFDERISVGRESEVRFRRYAESMGFSVIETSQHRDNPKNDNTRHFPDFFVLELSAFVQVKNGKNSAEYKNVIIEKVSYDAALYLSRWARVVLMWEFPNGDWMGATIHRINPCGEISDDARKNGSGTPAIKVDKSILVKFDRNSVRHGFFPSSL